MGADVYSRNARGGLSALTIVVSLLPSACCSSLIPTALVLLGGFYFAVTNAGKVQAILGLYDPAFTAVAMGLAMFSLYMASKDAACGYCRVTRNEDE
ncbi:hypothetical protein [Caldivirga sp.]|uniref:hypothetical protein n=1 Tax=Caldivirga sp. TaxID=2080243 RepID=UPI003D136B74